MRSEQMTNTLPGISMRLAVPVFACILATAPFLPAASAQGFINQTAIADIVNSQVGPVDSLPTVHYEYYVLRDRRNNSNLARNTFYKVLGRGDMDAGKLRSKLVELINRTLIYSLAVGDTIIIPTQFELDLRAYSPFPRYYTGARDFDKIVIIDKTVQAFAAYEHGKLIRWGIVNTGSEESPTPAGRYNFNWKTEYRVSSLSPPGEPWEMYWVFNLHAGRGIHIHQYPMPTGGPTSHGCVRLVEEDARWIYHWADTWKTSRGADPGSEQGRLLEQGTTVLIIGEDPPGHPRPFVYRTRHPILKIVDLPEDPYSVPPATDQQSRFDAIRLAGR